MHDVIQKEVQSAGTSIDAPSPDIGIIVKRGRNRRRMRWAGGVLTMAVLVAGLIVAVPDLLGDIRQNLRPTAQGEWERVPPAPIEGRAQPVAVWSGEEFLVWGGQAKSREFVDGAAYNPTTGEWRAIPPGPLESSAARSAVWTGTELILWGGESEGSHAPPDTGAAYNPVTDSWRALPPAPYWSLAGHSAVWTGAEMIVFGGVEGAMSRGASYDPFANEWTQLPAAPIAGRFRHTAVWTGTEMIVWGGRGPDLGRVLKDGAAFDPFSDSWRVLPDVPLEPRESSLGAWTGNEMLIWGGTGDSGEHWGADYYFFDSGAAFDPDTDSWRKIPRAPVESDVPGPKGGWVDGLLVVTANGGEFATYDVDEREWTDLPAMPGHFGYGGYGAAVAVGDGSLLLWGGYRDEDDLRADGFLLDLD